MKIGIIADVHYLPGEDELRPPRPPKPQPGEGHKPEEGPRPPENREIKNETLKRFYEFYEKESDCDFFINLGDLIEGTNDPRKNYFSVFLVTRRLIRSDKKTLYVIGNRDAFHIPKDMFVRSRDDIGSAYTFLQDDILFIALDANFTSESKPYSPECGEWTDSYIPEAQIEWLKRQLARTDFKKAVVMCHQRLDMFMNANEMLNPHVVANSDVVRDILEKSGKVDLVLQAHYHSGDISEQNGITYFTQPALYTNEKFRYSILTIDENGFKFDEKCS